MLYEVITFGKSFQFCNRFFDQLGAYFNRLGRSVVDEVFHETGKGIGAAVCFDCAGFGQVHKILSGTPQPVTAGAERWNVAHLGHISDYFVQRAMIAFVLLRIMYAIRSYYEKR